MNEQAQVSNQERKAWPRDFCDKYFNQIRNEACIGSAGVRMLEVVHSNLLFWLWMSLIQRLHR